MTDELLSLTFSAMPPLVVGVDFGTLSGRAVVVRVHDGAELGRPVTPYPHAVLDRALPDGTPLPPEWALQVPADYVEVLRTAVPAALAAAGVGPGRRRRHRHRLHGVHDGADHRRRHPAVRAAGVRRPSRTPTSSCGSTTPRRARPTGSTRSPASAGSRGCPATAGSSRRSGSSPRACRCWRRRPPSTRRCAHWVEAADWIVWQLTGTYVRNACTAGYKGIHQDGAYPSAEFCAALNPAFARFVPDKLDAPARAPRRPRGRAVRAGGGVDRAAGGHRGVRSATSTRTSPCPPRTPSSPACSSRSWARPPATS